MTLSILWGFIFANVTAVCFNLSCTIGMRYENWAYKLWDKKYTIPIYLGIYIGWLITAWEVNLYPGMYM